MKATTAKKTLVIAGTHTQFLQWCQETNTSPREAHYVSSPHVLYGLRLSGYTVVKTGTWWECDKAILDELERLERLEG
jgi:hypothetical protein